MEARMNFLLVLILAVAVVHGQEHYGLGSEITVECSQTPTSLYFKLMRRYALLLQSSLEDKIEATVQARGAAQCTLSTSSPLCLFENSETELFVKCLTPTQLVLMVARPELLGSGSKLTSRFVEISDVNFTRGVVSVLIENDLESQVRLLYNSDDIGKLIFATSSCVKSIALFEDHFRLAVQHSEQSCVIGLRRNIDARWSYRPSPKSVELPTRRYEDFCQKNAMRTYTLPQSENYTAELLVETDVEKLLNELQLTVVFHRVSEQDVVFNLTNYEKGIDPFAVKIHHDRPADSFTVSSNLDVFFLFSFEATRDSYLGLEEDEYIYTRFSKGFSFTLELDNFDEQKESPKAVKLYTSPNTPVNLKLKVAECQDEMCSIPTSPSPVIDGTFTPKCEHLVQQFCIVRITVEETDTQIYGLVAHVLKEHQEIDAGRYHHGTLKKDAIVKYVLKKEVLEKANDEFIVMAEGVHVYLTYDPECRRISCCSYDVRSGYKEVPNEKKDLYVFLQGTSSVKYHFLIDLKDNTSFVLHDGMIVRTQLGTNDTYKYFTYHVENPAKGLEINCNAPAGAVELLLSKDKTFDDTLANTFRSKACYIYVPPNVTQAGTNIHISVKREERHPGPIKFNIVAVPEGNEILLSYSTPYYDYLSKTASKKFVVLVDVEGVSHEGIAFKVDIPETLKGDHHVSVHFSSAGKEALTLVEWDMHTVMLNKTLLTQICQNQKKLCRLEITIDNLGDNALELDLLVWQRHEPVILTDGRFINFETGALQDVTHFYFDIANLDKPVNIFVSSTQVEVEVLWHLYSAEHDTPISSWPFPVFSQDKSQNILKGFTFSAFIDTDTLKEYAKGAKRLVVLMSVRDQSRHLLKTELFKEGESVMSLGSIQLIFTTGETELREDDKLEYFLLRDNRVYFTYDLGTLLHDNTTKQEIEFYHVRVMGVGDIEISWYLQEDGMEVSTPTNISGEVQVVAVSIDALRKQVQALNLTKRYELVFTVHSTTFIGRYLCNIVTSFSEYRELTLGVPEQFRIKPNGSAIFEFADALNKEFKIKVNRREGFPDYKIIGCSALESLGECFDQLDRHSVENDPSRMVVSGRSHELVINSKSEVYCKRCRYYIAFYAEQEVVTGSVTVIRSNDSVLLMEGRTLTTEVYGEEVDMYRIGVHGNSTVVRVSAFTGALVVTLFMDVPVPLDNQFQAGQSTTLQAVEEVQVDTNKSIEINVKAEQASELRTVAVRSKDSNPAMYTIFYASESFPVLLEDGMPIYIHRNQKDKDFSNTFQYNTAVAKATLIVMSSTKLAISLVCPDMGKATQIDTVTGLSKLNPDAERVMHIQHSLIWNITTATLDPNICDHYYIRIRGKEAVDYSIVISGVDIVFLPLGQLIPGRLVRGERRIYEVPIVESTKLKLSMRLCTKGQVTVGLTYDKADLKNDDLDNTFDISMEQDYQMYTHKARPGILYIMVKSLNRDIDYTLEVVNFNGLHTNDTIAYLEDPTIHHEFAGVLAPAADSNDSLTDKAKTAVTKLLEAGKTFEYNLEFTPLVIDSLLADYTITYVVVESPTRQMLETFVRCRGMFFGDTSNESSRIYSKEVLKLPSNENRTNATVRQKIKYQSKLESSYLSIVPVVSPKLPTHIIFQTYRIVRLSGASSNPFVKAYHMIAAVYAFFEAHSPFANTWHLYLLTTAVVFIVIAVVFLAVSALVACVGYQLQTYAYRRRSHRLPQSEFELRQQGHAANDTNLDMMERPNTSATLSLPQGDAPSQLV